MADDIIAESVDPYKRGKELFAESMRRVLTRKGYSGEALENRMNELLQKDVQRLAETNTGRKL